MLVGSKGLNRFVSSEDLDCIDVFRGINHFARKFLADHLKIVPFTAGDLMMYKGENPSVCYFILEGICHIRNPVSSKESHQEAAANPQKTKTTATSHAEETQQTTMERHQGFRSVGDSIGITATLAHYAPKGQVDEKVPKRLENLRQKYAKVLEAGANSSNTYAVTDGRLLRCDSETLLTAIQICPFLVANIAYAISLRMQQDTLLQRRAALPSNECLPLLAQFFYEWHMVLEANRKDEHRAKDPVVTRDQIKVWLRISDESALASGLRFLCGDKEAVQTLMAIKGLSQEAAESFTALQEVGRQFEVVGETALLKWWEETQSTALIIREQKMRKEIPSPRSQSRKRA